MGLCEIEPLKRSEIVSGNSLPDDRLVLVARPDSEPLVLDVGAAASLAYYLRFYCEYHLSEGPAKFGTPYSGTALFDFNVPILEFAPLLVLLFVLMVGRFGMGLVRPAN